ncbi:MAG: aminotransferase class III-fold pyridoxal phosphate-dependent enzyme, partial [Dehalococcoidia bacterium]
MTDWQQLEKRYFFATGKRQPVTLVRGQGVRVWDDQGREYLDFVAGIASVSLGHCHPVVVSALAEQANVLMHVSNLVYSVPQLRLAQLLVENSCLDRVFFCNSGAEAIEGAIKLAR